MMQLAAIGSAAILILSQASLLRAQDEPQKKETVRAFSLRVTGDGHVELTTTENGSEKTYKADSMEEFVKKYPDLAREHGLGRGARRFPVPGEFSRQFEEWRKELGHDGAWVPMPDLQKMLEGFRNDGAHEDGRPTNSHRLGVKLAPLGETLADQLSLDPKTALLISEVEPGSLAEKSGLKRNDLLVKVDGKDIQGMESVRDSVQSALKKKEFDLEILRQGKKQTLKITSPLDQ